MRAGVVVEVAKVVVVVVISELLTSAVGVNTDNAEVVIIVNIIVFEVDIVESLVDYLVRF